MTGITTHEVVAWSRRLNGSSARDGAASAPPDWFLANVIRMDGIAGLHQLSNFGVIDAEDPDAFEAVLVRAAIGDLMLFSTLTSPHLVTYDRGLRDDVDVVIIGITGHGGLLLRHGECVDAMSIGRVGYMSSLAPSTVDHIGISEVTGIVVPTALIASHLPAIASGVGLLPDTALTRTIAAAFTRLLCEWLQRPAPVSADIVTAEGVLLALVRGLLQQVSGDIEAIDRSADVRASAQQIIERRHRDSAFGVDELAAELHMSRRQLYRHFADTPQGIAEALMRRRLASAQEELLVVPSRDIESIALRSGFADAASLRAVFHRQLGVSPTQFRRTASDRRAQLAHAMRLEDEQSL